MHVLKTYVDARFRVKQGTVIIIPKEVRIINIV